MAPPAETATPAAASSVPALVRRLGLLDVTLIAMGGIIGSGIFVSPSYVAARAGSAGGRTLITSGGRSATVSSAGSASAD